MEGFRECLLESYREGYREGFLEGFQQGRLKASRRLVIVLLKAKFGEIPADVCSRVEDMNDEVALTSLAISCSNSQSMEEFMQITKLA